MKTFFYIIQRNGLIHEIENTGDRFASSLQQWQKGGLIIFPSLGTGINAVDITNILNEEKYAAFVDSVQPKLFIRNGSWYTSTDRKTAIRHEKWKDEEIENYKKTLLPPPVKEVVSQEKVVEIMKKYRPAFLTNTKI
jgi:hypothetical protein